MKKSVWVFVVVMLLSLCMAAFSACSIGGDSGNKPNDSQANSESYRENNISGDDKESESVSETQTGSESDKTSESESGETSESESESESKSESGEESVHTHKIERNADERYLKSSATCEKRAEYYFSCKCGEMGMQTFEHGDLLPHTEVIDAEREATCTKAGFSAGKHCSVCNKVLEAQIAIPALGHDLAMHEGKASTCTEKGYAAYETCRRCDYMTYRVLPLAEHELENGICKNCGREITPHTHIEVIDEGKPATCVEDGEMTYRCSTCDPDNNIIHVSIPALGHDLVYWSDIEGDTVIVQETCMREGCSLEEKRTTIGNINNSEIFVKDIERSKPATCTLEGIDVYEFYYVNICGGIVNLEVHVITQKLNHNEYYVETSWKKDGVIYYGYYCEKCDQYIITRTETEA